MRTLYACRLCASIFSRGEDAAMHLRVAHLNSDISNVRAVQDERLRIPAAVTCERCGEIFSTKRMHDDHPCGIIVDDVPSVPKQKCYGCGKRRVTVDDTGFCRECRGVKRVVPPIVPSAVRVEPPKPKSILQTRIANLDLGDEDEEQGVDMSRIANLDVEDEDPGYDYADPAWDAPVAKYGVWITPSPIDSITGFWAERTIDNGITWTRAEFENEYAAEEFSVIARKNGRANWRYDVREIFESKMLEPEPCTHLFNTWNRYGEPICSRCGQVRSK